MVYAGWGAVLGSEAVSYDTVNILTLPAFHWISVPYNPQNPRAAHTCNAVGGSQILIIGGVDISLPELNDTTHISSESYATQDPNAQGLAIFDLTNLTWSTQYTAGASPYQQSEEIKAVYTDPNL